MSLNSVNAIFVVAGKHRFYWSPPWYIATTSVVLSVRVMLRVVLAGSFAWLLSLLPVVSARSLVFLDLSYYRCTNFIIVLTMADGKAYRFSHHEPDSFVKFYVRDIKQVTQIALIANEWETRRYDMEVLGPQWNPWWGWYEIELRKDYETGYENSWFRPRAAKRWAVYRNLAESSEDSDDEGLIGLRQPWVGEDRRVSDPIFAMQGHQVKNVEPEDSGCVSGSESKIARCHTLGEQRGRRRKRERKRRRRNTRRKTSTNSGSLELSSSFKVKGRR